MASCDDFLDVRPDSEKLESDLFSNAQGFEDAIYGVYGCLQSTSLYGKELSWGLADIMSQDLGQNTVSSLALARYQYENDELKSRFAEVWADAYTTIGYANNILKNLAGRSEAELPLFNLYKGEMLGVRAMLHFDLLRLFCSTDEAARGIPYSTDYSMHVNEFRSVGEVYDLILSDLAEAEKLLKGEADAIVYPRDNTDYYKFRNYRETHCNYYAVLALTARVCWMRGDLAKAGEYACRVIDSGKYPLVEPNANEVKDVFAGRLSPKETIWGVYSTSYNGTCEQYLYNHDTYSSYDPYSDVTGSAHLMPYEAVYGLDVEATAQDFRASNWFKNDGYTANCVKMVDRRLLEDQATPEWNERIRGFSLLHVSELYLVAAEALLDADYGRAAGYFEEETSSRGLPRLRPDVTLTREMIYNEYHKEMFGEGQVWFNMKRLGRDIVSNLDSRTIPASEDVYVLPIPQDEFNYRN